MSTTYYFRFEDGTVALNGDVEPTWVTPEEVFTMSHPRHVARILNEHPELPIAEIVTLTAHFDEIEGIDSAACVCDDCQERFAEQQASEIAAETGYPQHMVW